MAQATRVPDVKLDSRTQNLIVAALAAVAAVGGAISGAEPTGTAGWDPILNAAFAALLTLGGSKAQRWAVIVFATLIAATSGTTLWTIVAVVGMALSIGAALLDRRSRVLGALTAALAVQTGLRLPSIGFFGLQSVIMALGTVILLFSAYQYSQRRTRQIVRRVSLVAAVVTVLILVVGGVSLLNARSDVDRGVAAARRGLQSARAGDAEALVADLEQAQRALEQADGRLSGVAARSLRIVPVVAQHQRAVQAATAQGAQVASQAASTLNDADISTISLEAGSVDLTALREMAPQLEVTADSLRQALEVLENTDSGWIVPPVRDRIADLSVEIQDLLPEVEVGAQAARVVPGMLGADGARTYFVMFGTPAESREMGGFVGSWAVVRFDNGSLQLGDSGRILELYGLARESTIEPGTASDIYLEMARPTNFPQNLTASPSFEQVAAVARQVLAGVSQDPIDGFIYLDAVALIDLLELTGPVQVPFQEQPLTPDNAGQFFFRDQYELEENRADVFDTLADVARNVLTAINQGSLPGPETLGRVMGPAARGGHLQVITFDDEENDFLRSVKLLRDFGQDDTSDYLAVVQSNGRPNKMDLYLERDISYQATVDDDGQFQATVTVELASVIPEGAPLATVGSGTGFQRNRVILSLYSPHVLQTATIDGAPVEFAAVDEFGLARYVLQVDVPRPGEAPSITAQFELAGFVDPALPYEIEIWHQPLVNTDQYDVEFDGPNGQIRWQGPLVENVVLGAENGE